MELAEKGAVMEMSSGSNARALSQETCRKYFGQLVEAIDYGKYLTLSSPVSETCY